MRMSPQKYSSVALKCVIIHGIRVSRQSNGGRYFLRAFFFLIYSFIFKFRFKSKNLYIIEQWKGKLQSGLQSANKCNRVLTINCANVKMRLIGQFRALNVKEQNASDDLF